MKLDDIKSMMRDIAPVIREYTAKELAPLAAKIEALEKRDDGNNIETETELARAAIRGGLR